MLKKDRLGHHQTNKTQNIKKEKEIKQKIFAMNLKLSAKKQK